MIYDILFLLLLLSSVPLSTIFSSVGLSFPIRKYLTPRLNPFGASEVADRRAKDLPDWRGSRFHPRGSPRLRVINL